MLRFSRGRGGYEGIDDETVFDEINSAMIW